MGGVDVAPGLTAAKVKMTLPCEEVMVCFCSACSAAKLSLSSRLNLTSEVILGR